jgi:hypothetical protein
MKTILLSLSVIAAASVMLVSCGGGNCVTGSGKQVTEQRKVTKFSQIDISGDYQLIIKQDTGTLVNITADDNLMQYIKTDVSGDKLTIKKNKNICSTGKFTVNITMPNLAAIKAAGAIDISSDGKITTKDLSLDLAGANKVTLNLNADNVTTQASGIVNLNFTGQASSHSVALSGSGELNALDFVVAKYRIDANGASHCKINVLNDLSVNTSGASQVEYRGNPKNIDNSKSGASSLKKID